MPEVVIGSGAAFFAYADLETADAYMNGAIGAAADAWRLASDDDKGRGLVAMTRQIDARNYPGEKTAADQPGQFPRTGINNPDGSAVPEDEIPERIVFATIEGAALLVAGEPVIVSATGTAKRLKAGSVEIENWRDFSLKTGAFVPDIQRLLSWWLAGGRSATAGSQSFGTCQESSFGRGWGFRRGL